VSKRYTMLAIRSGTQGWSDYTAGLPPDGCPYRGAYLCGLHGLLPPGDPQAPGPAPWLRALPLSRHPGQVCHHSPSNRRPRSPSPSPRRIEPWSTDLL